MSLHLFSFQKVMKTNLVKPRMLETELLEAEDLLEVVYLVLQNLEVVEVSSILFSITMDLILWEPYL